MSWINRHWKLIFLIIVSIAMPLMLTDNLTISSIILMWAPTFYVWKATKDSEKHLLER